MKIFHIICSSPLPSGIGKSPDRKTGNNDHHTAPEQIGEDVSKCAVKHAQRNTDQDGTQGLPARKSPRQKKGCIAEDKEKSRWLSSRTLTHKRPAVFWKIRADTSSSRRIQGRNSHKSRSAGNTPVFGFSDTGFRLG